MRDINRMPSVLNRLHEAWKLFPDWRFCQLMSNFNDYIIRLKGVDMFHIEDDEFIDLLDYFCREYSYGFK